MSKASQIRQKAQNLLKKGQFDKAIDEYKRLVSVESRNPNLCNELGDIYLKAGNRIAAVTSFEKASKNYESVALYNNAVAVCKKILRVVPQHLETMYKLGELRIKQHLEGEGINYFNQLLDLLLGDAERDIGDLNLKLEHMLELAPANEDVHSKVAIIFERMGRKVKAVEILSNLCSHLKERGALDRLEVYAGRIAAVRSGLTSAEASEAKRILSEEEGGVIAGKEVSTEESAALQEPIAPAVEEVVIEDGATPAGDEVIVENEATPAGDEAIVAGEAAPAVEEVVIEDRPTPAAKEVIVENEPTPVEEPAVAVDTGGGAGISESGAYGKAAFSPDASPESGPAAGTAEDRGIGAPDRSENVETAHGQVKKDFSSITGSEENWENITEKLADEITSDVEKDDHQGHYDLGMAYLEMALYTDAIKEFQGAARSEQLQMKSYEMIGNCFLLQNNPRLAVKQLLRGLEVARSSGGDPLGIHYNLGLAFEMLGEDERAREHFEEVCVVDITFRDVKVKIEKYNSLS